MQGRTRRATALGAAAFVLAGSAVLGAPGTASAAESKTAVCGGSVTADPGSTIFGTTPLLGIPLNLGKASSVPGVQILTGTINALLNTLCRVTVTVVDTVIAPVPVVGAPLASAANKAVGDTNKALTNGVDSAGRALSPGQPAPQQPGPGGNPQQPPNQGGAPEQGGTPAGQFPIPDANSPLLPGSYTPNFSGLPFDLSTGFSPMRDYSSIPMAMAGLFTPSPGLRYGGQVPGYAPQFGLTGPDGTPAGNSGIQNAGQAEALPGVNDGFTNGSQLPVLIAVLALSGVSAGLVRTWVLRRMASSS